MAERGLRSSGDLCLRCAARSFGADLNLDFEYRQYPHEHSGKTRQSGRASEINHRHRCPQRQIEARQFAEEEGRTGPAEN